MILAVIFWSGAFIAGKYSIKEFPPFTLTFLRFSIAFIVIFFFMVKFEKNWKIKLKDTPYFIFLGIIGMFGYHVLFFIALKYTTVINSSLIGAALNPLTTTLLAVFLLKDKLSFKKAGWISLSIIGAFLTITEGNLKLLFQSGINVGDLCMIIAVLCWAVYTVASKKVSLKFPPLVIITYSFLFCSLILIPFALMERPWTFLGKTSSTGWLSILYMAIFPSVIGFLIQQISVKKIGPRRTSMFIFLVPVFSIILSVLILKEVFHPIKIFSSLLIIIGVYFSTQN
jgi:drug/metabolite transporter (DMT)-like permease